VRLVWVSLSDALVTFEQLVKAIELGSRHDGGTGGRRCQVSQVSCEQSRNELELVVKLWLLGAQIRNVSRLSNLSKLSKHECTSKVASFILKREEPERHLPAMILIAQRAKMGTEHKERSL
jgi:hypothetical protein